MAPYLEPLHGEFEIRPIADQVIDSLLVEDPERYEMYNQLRMERPWGILPAESFEGDAYRDVGYFMTKWIELETFLGQIVPSKRPSGPVMPTGRQLLSIGLLDENMAFEFDRIRRTRNNLVHGIETPEPADLQDSARLIDEILRELRRRTK